MTELATPAPRPGLLDIEAYVQGESHISGVNRIYKLSSNEGAFGPPQAAIAAYQAMAPELHRYPDGSYAALRQAIGARFHLDPERIVCGVGSDEIISMLALSYGGAGTEVIMSAHGFSMYEIAGRYAGSTVRRAAERDLTADVDAILAEVSDATRIVFLANPNNPTGSLLPTAEVRRLRDRLPSGVLLVLDAAYAEYVEDPDYEAGAALVDGGENTVMTRTFSKIFGLGGMRVGWAYAPASVLAVLNRVRSPFNIGIASQAAAAAALAEPDWVERSVAHNARWRAWLGAALTRTGIKVWPSHGNFFLADFATPERATAADAALKARGIIVRGMRGYGLAHCLRITVGTGEECEAVAAALADFMAGQTVRA
jgi:histidinol-phosphate aminotransferase